MPNILKDEHPSSKIVASRYEFASGVLLHKRGPKYAISLCYKSPPSLEIDHFLFPKLYLFFDLKTFLFYDIPQNFEFFWDFLGTLDSFNDENRRSLGETATAPRPVEPQLSSLDMLQPRV